MKFEKHCWAEVDLDALTENFRWIHRHVGGDVCCVVKANAYGHGSCAAADALQAAGAAAFAVSCLAEARELRRHGIDKPILILGYTDPDFADELAGLHITQALFSTQYAEALSTAATTAGCRVECHLKADTGMGRIGFAVRTDFEAAIRAMEQCYALPGLKVTGLFSTLRWRTAPSLTTRPTPTSSTPCSPVRYRPCRPTGWTPAPPTAPTVPPSCATPNGGPG